MEEIERGMCSVAAPLGPPGQPPTLSIGAAGSTRVFTPTFREQIGADLVRMAHDLAMRLGWDDRAPSQATA